MLKLERRKILLEAYEAGKRGTIQLPDQDTATAITGLSSCQKAQKMQFSAQGRKVNNSIALTTPPHIRSALHTWRMVSTERFSNPLEYDRTYKT
eukprot:1157015-Pelagomonas_calceolata.AAC.2